MPIHVNQPPHPMAQPKAAVPIRFALHLDMGIGSARGDEQKPNMHEFLKVEFGLDRAVFDQARIAGEFDVACQALGQQLAMKLCHDLPRMGPHMAKLLAEQLKKVFDSGSQIILPGELG
jgi:hypothetical protein